MRRLTAFGWALLVLGALTVVLSLAAPGAGLVAAALLVLLLAGAAVEGWSENAGWFDIDRVAERRREVMRQRFPWRARRRWEDTPPDAPDEPAEAIWARERQRRGRYTS